MRSKIIVMCGLCCFLLTANGQAVFAQQAAQAGMEENQWLDKEVYMAAQKIWRNFITGNRDKGRMEEMLGLFLQMELLLTSRTGNSLYLMHVKRLPLPQGQEGVLAGAFPMHILLIEIYRTANLKLGSD